MKLRIGAHTYRVVDEPNLRDEHDKPLWGRHDPNTGIIYLHSRLRLVPTRRFASLLHEVIHALDCNCGLGLSEEQTDRLAEALADFLLRNGWLGKALLKRMIPNTHKV